MADRRTNTRRPWFRSRVAIVVSALVLMGIAIVLALWPSSTRTPEQPPTRVGKPTPAKSIQIGPDEVLVGMYVANIQVVSPDTNSFAADIYTWFRWSNPELKPWRTVEFMNLYEAWQLTTTSQQEGPRKQPDGTLYYASRAQGFFNSPLDLRDYPFGTQDLNIVLEDFEFESSKLRFITGPDSVAIDPDLSLPGYTVGAPSIKVSRFTYPTNFGDSDMTADERYSRVTVSTPVSHPVWTNVIKYLIPIILVVIAAGLIFEVPPSMIEARIGLSITALLTLVAMEWSATDHLPLMAYVSLLDVLYIVALIFILGSLIAGLRVSWIARDHGEARAVTVDERWLVAYFIAFAVVFAATVAAFMLI